MTAQDKRDIEQIAAAEGNSVSTMCLLALRFFIWCYRIAGSYSRLLHAELKIPAQPETTGKPGEGKGGKGFGGDGSPAST